MYTPPHTRTCTRTHTHTHTHTHMPTPLPPPGEPSDYVHRVGRSARMGQSGDSVLFLLPSERGYLEVLARHGVVVGEEAALPVLNRALGTDAKVEGLCVLG